LKKAPHEAGPKARTNNTYKQINIGLASPQYALGTILILHRTSRRPDLSRSLRKLKHMRRDLNHHRRTGHPGPLPQPWQYGLNLPDLKPSEIFWPGGAA
jgi:hypothetical protein